MASISGTVHEVLRHCQYRWWRRKGWVQGSMRQHIIGIKVGCSRLHGKNGEIIGLRDAMETNNE